MRPITIATTVGFGLGLFCATACLVEIKELQPSSGTGGQGGAATGTASGSPSTGGGDMGGGDAGGGDAGGAGGGSGGFGGGGGGEPCPADMVHAQHPSFPAVSFCIDRTEVSQADYTIFLASVGSVENTDQPAECAGNTELTRTDAGSNCPVWSAGDDRAVNCVDWCDAYAYCAWAGKRLCGALEDGGALAFDAPVTGDEWQFACSGGLQTTYPYGNQGQICACYIPEEWQAAMMCGYENVTSLNLKAEVGSHPDCEGGFPGIFDMQGNAAEWTNRCEPANGGTEHCSIRGGHTYSVSGSSFYTCDNLAQSEERLVAALEVGIRCCRDAQ